MHDDFESRLEQLEDRVSDLRRQVVEARADAKEAQEAIKATTALYEQRVDQIYRRVSVALRSYLDLTPVDSPTEIETDAVLSKAFGAALGGADGMTAEQLRSALSPQLRPGLLAGPLTVRGFRLNRRTARERGDAILMTGEHAGIAVFGPYKELAPGRYSVAALVRANERNTAGPGRLVFDIYRPAADQVQALAEPPEVDPSGGFRLEAQFNWPGGEIEFRIQNNTGAGWLLTGFDLVLHAD
jgi:hypothetical protein